MVHRQGRHGSASACSMKSAFRLLLPAVLLGVCGWVWVVLQALQSSSDLAPQGRVAASHVIQELHQAMPPAHLDVHSLKAKADMLPTDDAASDPLVHLKSDDAGAGAGAPLASGEAFSPLAIVNKRPVQTDQAQQGGGHPSSQALGAALQLRTLQDLPPGQAAGMSWLDKGQWLLDTNKAYLQAARAKPFRSLTMVSAMVDLGRGKLGGGFARPFSAYVNRMRNFMKYDFPKVVFLDAAHLKEFQPLIDTSPGPVHVIAISKADIKAGFRHFDAVQAVRTQPQWAKRKDWLSHSPQATLEYYNPLVMSKMNMTAHVAQLNPFNTDGFLFIDGGHLCNAPNSIKRATHESSIIDRFMKDGIAITYYDYVPDAEDGEIHGFEAAAFHRYMGTQEEPIRVGRGGFFGGRPELLQIGAQLLDIIAEDTLKQGYMGTEENYFALLLYRFKDIVQFYDNGERGNCAIFDDIVRPRADDSHYRYKVRGLKCLENYAQLAGQGKPSCFMEDGQGCPAKVTPPFLKQADTQWSCHNLKEFYCVVTCYGEIKWYANSCGAVDRRCKAQVQQLLDVPGPGPEGVADDRPTGLEVAVKPSPSAAPAPVKPAASPSAPQAAKAGAAAKQQGPASEVSAQLQAPEPPPGVTSPLAPEGEYGEQGPLDGYDLRGLRCAQRKDGSPICYTDDPYDKDYCPPSVTPEFLSAAKGQWACSAEAPDDFCTAACTGDGQVKWFAHNKKWCKKDPSHCPPMQLRIPKDQLVLPHFQAPQVQPRACRARAGGTWANNPEAFWFGNAEAQMQEHAADRAALRGKGSRAEVVAGVSVAMLVMGKESEINVLRGTLATYEANGLLGGVKDFMVWVNGKTEASEALLQPLVEKWGVRVMGSDKNAGQLEAINALVRAATQEHILFLEKDFRMIEPWTCGAEQLTAGVAMIEAGTAHMVRYRHRWRAGKPNWALNMFRGKEDRVFKQQPNLFCNHFHWIEHPEKIWPDKIWFCNKDPYMYCSDSKYCNWTANPHLFSKTWWLKEYVEHFEKRKWHNNPYENIEYYLNWEANSWNDRGWTVAQGEGLFRHEDFAKWG